jgi:hypothetical protein
MKIDHCPLSARPREEAQERMIANEVIPAPTRKATPEEEALLERASAPTLRDLRKASRDLLTTIETEMAPSSHDDGLPQQED